MPADARGCSGAAAGGCGAGFFDRLLDNLTGFTRALLNPTKQFVLLALDKLEIIIRELGPFLFQLALGDVPVAFDFKSSHMICFVWWLIVIRRQHDDKAVPAAGGFAEGRPQSRIFPWGVTLR